MDFLTSMKLAASGLRAQSGRMRIIAENIANADSTGTTKGADPYRRKMPSFQATLDRATGASVVEMGPVRTDRSDFKSRFEPGHPAADADGYVKLPNVNTLIETVDMRQAQRSYEANLNVIQSTRTMMQRTLDILRG
tara:strand:+ start:3157 stop:3567 length:411 start_codon:yes stop_codon:yes gene_type:complete